MASPGFEFQKNVEKADGTHERIEGMGGYRLKKYTTPSGTSFSSVQAPKQSRADYLQSLGEDNFTGFRSIFGEDK